MNETITRDGPGVGGLCSWPKLGWLALCLCSALSTAALSGAMPDEAVGAAPVVPLPAPEEPIELAPAPEPPPPSADIIPIPRPPSDPPRMYCQRSEDVGKPMSVLQPSNRWACRETPDAGGRGDRDRGPNGSDGPGDGDGPSGPDPGPDPGSPDGPSNGADKDDRDKHADKKSKRGKKDKN